MDNAFSKPFEPNRIEPLLRDFWEKNKFYKAKPNSLKKPYTIVIPPPNVTGDLHMGHMLNNTIQDTLIRWHRAKGFEACWIPGTDHASIATDAKVTAMLKEQGINKKEIGRKKFLEHCWEWKEKYGGRIIHSLKALGISCDWDRYVFTMDESYTKAVTRSFVKLYKDGLVYRGYRLVNWCPASQSVISDEEVNFDERNGSLWYINYKLENSDKYITVATTRPETLFGDLAVAVHPDDERYKSFIGKNVVIPVSGRSIPVVGDTYCDMEMGTGAVKITPAHDMNDFEVGKRHNLGLMNIMNPDATLNDKVPEGYRGLDRFVARKKLIAELEKTGGLEKTEPYKLKVGISERGNVPIEYYLSEQWYFKMDGLAKLALDATRSKKLTLRPAHNEKVWEHWLTNIQDWCVSRQLWWGHPIPVYTCAKCQHVHCEEVKPAQCVKCKSSELVDDPDVIDTWASSWLWPFAVHDWVDPTAEQKASLDYFYPTDVIVTGADIIFFWIARMVMAGEYFTGKTPFQDVYFTPIVRDDQGRKMSKSLGNSPDTHELIANYGTDALRFSLMNQIVPGQDIHWANKSCEIGRTFANKIWNATRFLLMNCEKFDVKPENANFDNLQIDKEDPLLSWVSSEFFAMTKKAHEGIQNYEFSNYTNSLYDFVWMVYCDWFVELMKPRFNEGADTVTAAKTLTAALDLHDGILRLLHPIMPYLTEEIWHSLSDSRTEKTIGNEKLPEHRADVVDEKSIQAMREVQAMVNAVRTVRGQLSIHPGTELKVAVESSSERFGNLLPQMEFLTKAKFNFNSSASPFSAPAQVNGVNIYVDLKGHIDPEAEKKRIVQKVQKLEQTIQGIEKRLSNTDFVKGAPAHILDGAKSQLLSNQSEIELLKKSLAQLEKHS